MDYKLLALIYSQTPITCASLIRYPRYLKANYNYNIIRNRNFYVRFDIQKIFSTEPSVGINEVWLYKLY